MGSQGEITTSFVFSRQFVDEHDLNGLRDKNSDIFTNSLLADVTFSVRDNLSVTVAIPIVSSKFVTAGTPPHPTIQDDGSYHTTATDLRFDVRYNVFNRRNLVITPFIGSVTPSHKYEYFAHAAPGRRVNELQVGTYVGTTLDGLLPGMFVQGRYGFGIQERFLDISHNRSLFSGEMGYFATPDIRVFGMVSGQVTHGGVDLSPTARLVWPAEKWQNHDRITREELHDRRRRPGLDGQRRASTCSVPTPRWCRRVTPMCWIAVSSSERASACRSQCWSAASST